MKIVETPLDGLVLIEPTVFGDARGYFYEMYHRRAYQNAGIDVEFVQDNRSASQQGVLRGLHFQKKILRVNWLQRCEVRFLTSQ